MSTTPDTDKSTLETAWANRLAEELGETGEPRRRLRRLARLVGLSVLEEMVQETRTAVASSARETRRADGNPRTPGGVFFRVAKANVKRRLTEGRERGDLPAEERQRLHAALRVFVSGNEEQAPERKTA